MKVKYNNLYTHFVFISYNRLPLIEEKDRDRIEKYITGIIKNNDCHLYSIYANPDHTHMLISRSPNLDEETLASIIANSSSKFINQNKLCTGNFQWQDSCSAFSISKKDVDRVCKYILNQKKHHLKQTFAEEYSEFIKFYQS
ncbi:MAG: transposase [Dysgonamonadaceae bacterium]|nr:transposase [Dysgonamonadaceae bacterium]MDD4727332.1 transposase [Dysgonamonadaceae bacterium]